MKNPVAPSKKFKEKASLAIAAVTFYFIIYLLLLSGSLAITGYAIYGGISLIINFPRIFTVLLGIGIILFAVLILVFLIKFLFVRNKIDLSGFIALKEEEEPEFFKLVYDLAEEVGTKKPKKIYLSPEVNAAVFYEHPILSMLFPVSKNLVVGVGLINSMKENELRAILAHEFGHFSQRSMKIGSYAASANKMIHNMLFENDSYQNMASSVNGGHIIVNLLSIWSK